MKMEIEHHETTKERTMSASKMWIEQVRDKWYDFTQAFEENKLPLFYALLALLNNFGYGLSSYILDTTLTDLGYIYDASETAISYFYACYYCGFMVGSGGNLLYKWFNRQLLLVFFVMIMAVTIALLPHYGTIHLAYVFMVINGIGTGAWDAGNYIWLIEVWPSRIVELFQINQFVYNLGGAVTGLLTANFVYDDAELDEENRTLTVLDRRMSLAFPYTLVGYIQSIIPFIFLALYFVNRYQKRPLSRKAQSHHMNPFTPTSKLSKRKRKLTLYYVWLLVYYLGEIGYYVYFDPMLSQLEFGEENTAKVIVAYTITYTVGPLVTTFVSLKLRTDYIISYCYVIIVTALLIGYFGFPNPTLVIISNAMIGFGFSPVLPSMLSFAEIFLHLTEKDVAMYTCISGLVWLVTPFIVENGLAMTPWFIYIYEAAFIPSSIVLFLIIRWWMFHNSQTLHFYMEHRKHSII